jgi:hypothetical protein
MSPTAVGLQPWLPWPLSRWRWWTDPVRAERLAALRIGLCTVLLLDVLLTYWPNAAVFFGRDSFGSPEVVTWMFPAERAPDPLSDATGWFSWLLRQPRWRWSLLRDVQDPRVITAAMAVWLVAISLTLVGLCTRLTAVVVWVLSTSFAYLNPNIDNAGDQVRGIILFYLMLTPCGAAWSLDAWLSRRGGPRVPAFIYPWALRLLFVQMVLIYFCNGVHKFVGHDWRAGTSLYLVLGDLTLARFSYTSLPVPYSLLRLSAWFVLVWEVMFPILVLWRPVRVVALAFGAAFHVGIWVTMELGCFAPYMLCLYLPLLPWERWVDRRSPDTAPRFCVPAVS